MLALNWDDPLGKRNDPPKNKSDLAQIREDQKKLIDPINVFRDAAILTLKLIIRDPRLAPLYLEANKHRITMNITYRLPDYPGVVNEHTHTLDDYPINISVKPNSTLWYFHQLVPLQRVPPISNPNDRLAAANVGNEVQQYNGIGMGPTSGDIVTVYPRSLAFATWWIEHIEGPIHHIIFADSDKKEASYKRESSPITIPSLPVPSQRGPLLLGSKPN